VHDDLEAAASPVTLQEAPGRDGDLSSAVDGWVAAFDREMEQSGDFAASIAAITAHGCFDVRAVAERWMQAQQTGAPQLVPVQPAPVAPVELVPVEPAPPESVLLETPDVEAAAAPPVETEERTSRTPGAASSPDIAYFRSLLQGGIERAQIDEAFPGFRLVIDEAVEQHASGAEPILSDVPPPPTREDLNDEIRGMREKLQSSAKRGRRRWRSRG
jgi:hypothetical protein